MSDVGSILKIHAQNFLQRELTDPICEEKQTQNLTQSTKMFVSEQFWSTHFVTILLSFHDINNLCHCIWKMMWNNFCHVVWNLKCIVKSRSHVKRFASIKTSSYISLISCANWGISLNFLQRPQLITSGSIFFGELISTLGDFANPANFVKHLDPCLMWEKS